MDIQNIIFFFQIISNIIFFLNYKKLSKLINIYDKPDKIRKFHKQPVPILGGILIFLNFFLFLPILVYFKGTSVFLIFSDYKNFLLFYIFFSIFFLIGLFDDIKNLSPKLRLILTFLASFLIILLDNNLIINSISIFNVELNFVYEPLSILFTVFCFIVLINALNMLDGINLQFSIYCIIIIFFIASKNFNIIYFLFLIPLIFFSFLNLRSKAFMGDAGTYSVAFFFSYTFIKLFNNSFLNEAEIILLLLVPGLELIRVFFIRIINKKSPFRGDRNHLHHYLINKTSLTNALLIFIFLSLIPIILHQLNSNLIAFLIPVLIYFLIIYVLKKNN